MMNFDGLKLRDAIARRQSTIKDFAKDTGLSATTIRFATLGGRATTRTLGKIAATLGVDTPSTLLQPAQVEGGKSY